MIKKAIKNVVEQTKHSIVSTVGVIVMSSLPSTPQVPAMASAKKFVGQSFATGQVVMGAKGMLDSLSGLEKLGKKRK